MADSQDSNPRRSHEIVADRKAELFLEWLASTGQVVLSAKKAGYTTPMALYKKRREDEDFAQRWEEALQQATDTLEDEAIRRARDGVDEPVFYQGRQVGTVTKYSDQLLQFLLRGNKPKKYRENQGSQGEGAGTFGIAILPMAVPSTEQWEQLAQQKGENSGGPVIDVEPQQKGGKTVERE